MQQRRAADMSESLPGIFSAAPVGIASVAAGGRFESANPAFCRAVGLDQADVVGRRWSLPGVELDRVLRRGLVRRLLAGEIDEGEIEGAVRHGGDRVRLSVSLQRDGAGDPLRFIIALVARTDARQVAEELAELARRSPDGVILGDVAGRTVYLNEAAAALVGRDAEELVGTPLDAYRPPWARAVAAQRVSLVCSGRTVHESREAFVHPDRSEVLVEVSSSPIERDGDLQVLSVLRDVTERAWQEAALREIQERHRIGFEHSSAGQAIVDLDGTYLETNPALRRMLGRSAVELSKLHYRDITHPEDIGTDRERIAKMLAGDPAPSSWEKRYLLPGGEVLWAEVHVALVRDELGEPAHFISQVDDITERRTHADLLQSLTVKLTDANEALRVAAAEAERTSQRYRGLLDHLPDTVVYVYDTDHRIVATGGGGVGPLGRDARTVTGLRLQQLVTPPEAELVGHWLDTASTGQSLHTEFVATASGAAFDLHLLPLPAAAGESQELMVVARDITDQRDRERQLAVAEARWRSAFELAPVAMLEAGLDRLSIHANAAMLELTGRSGAELAGMDFVEVYAPEDREAAREQANRVVAGASARSGAPHRIVRPDGTVRWAIHRGAVIKEPSGAPQTILVQLFDVTGEREQQARIEALHARFAALLEHGADPIFVARLDGAIDYASPAAARLLGVATSDLNGRDVATVMHPDDRGLLEPLVRALLDEPDRPQTFECRLLGPGGTWRHVEATATNRIDDPAVNGLVVNARDVTERVQVTARLAHQATHDALTGLANRTLLVERLATALARAARSGRPCAVLFADLDGFKQVNDSLGHAAGDLVLAEVARRLRETVRPEDAVARIGGDEFVVLVEDLNRPADDVAVLAERLRLALDRSIDLGNDGEAQVGCSIGIAFSTHSNPEALLREADLALYRAKGQQGRRRWEIYNHAMRVAAHNQVELDRVARDVLSEGGLEVHYQPIVDLGTGAVVAHEALARLRSADGRLLTPADFLAVAESSELICLIGGAVLSQACNRQSSLLATTPELRYVAVNVAARHLAEPGFVDEVAAALAEADLAPGQLQLEVTESTVIGAGPAALGRLQNIEEMGVGIALDDFGTGASSLSHLRRLAFDTIKIDKSFVDGLGSDRSDTEIVAAVTSLAAALGIPTVAEGVETPRQAELLAQLGCAYAQGYLFGRPQPG